MIKEFAKKYRAIGWNVIPLYHHTKNPSAIRWKEYEDRMSTDEEFAKWFDDATVTGLGVITGKLSGIVAVDEDSYKANGMKFEFESPLVSKTARNGRHHFFKYTEPIKTSGFRQGINIEIKSDGGFLVLPPSEVEIDPVTHNRGNYEWLKKCDIKRLPTITETQLLPYRGGISPQAAVEIGELVYAPIGTQHNNLRTIALATFNRFKEAEWDIATSFIRQAASNFDPPHSEDRVDKIIADAMHFVKIHPKGAVEKEVKKEKKTYVAQTTSELAQERIADRALEKVAPKTGWPELDGLIKGFIPGHIYTLTGDTNVGKTTIAANFTEALREQEKKVLYIALEPDVNVVEYLASVRRKKPFSEISDDELQVIGEPDQYVKVFRGKDLQSADELIEAVEQMEEHFDLIIIDHIGYFVNSENNWIQQQGNVIKQLAALAKTQKTAIMLIAHLRKPSTSPKKQEGQEGGMWIPTQNDIAGSAAFKQDSTEVMIAIRKYKPNDEFSIEFTDEGYLMVTKTKVGPNGVVPLIFSKQSALILSRGQKMATPEGRQDLALAEYEAQQVRLGDPSEDEWGSND